MKKRKLIKPTASTVKNPAKPLCNSYKFNGSPCSYFTGTGTETDILF